MSSRGEVANRRKKEQKKCSNQETSKGEKFLRQEPRFTEAALFSYLGLNRPERKANLGNKARTSNETPPGVKRIAPEERGKIEKGRERRWEKETGLKHFYILKRDAMFGANH